MCVPLLFTSRLIRPQSACTKRNGRRYRWKISPADGRSGHWLARWRKVGNRVKAHAAGVRFDEPDRAVRIVPYELRVQSGLRFSRPDNLLPVDIRKIPDPFLQYVMLLAIADNGQLFSGLPAEKAFDAHSILKPVFVGGPVEWRLVQDMHVEYGESGRDEEYQAAGK